VSSSPELRAAVLASVVGHARDTAPNECCGLLLGRGEDITEAVAAKNIAEAPEAQFLIDPRDHIMARRDARARGLDVVGFYHSHPRTPAEPSERDRVEYSYAGDLYLIVSLRAEPAEVGLFRFDAGNFHRLRFVTVA
jgi:proteasome lid subunit RPN8/RPN11